MIACAVIVLGLWAEALWRAHRQRRAERVRVSLTPEGEAAVAPTPRVGVPGQPPLVDLDALSRVFADDQAAAERPKVIDFGGGTVAVDATEWLRRKAQQD
jgi:hypothetical protein